MHLKLARRAKEGGKRIREKKNRLKPPNFYPIPPLQDKQLKAVYSSLLQCHRHLSPGLRSRMMNSSSGEDFFASAFKKPPNYRVYTKKALTQPSPPQLSRCGGRRLGRGATQGRESCG